MSAVSSSADAVAAPSTETYLIAGLVTAQMTRSPEAWSLLLLQVQDIVAIDDMTEPMPRAALELIFKHPGDGWTVWVTRAGESNPWLQPFLLEASAIEPTSAFVLHHARRISADARKRRTLGELRSLTAEAECVRSHEKGELDSFVIEAADRIYRAGQPRTESVTVELAGATAKSVLDGLENPGQWKILDTGLPAIDDFLGGLRPADYVVIGACPSRGKSVLGAEIAYQVALTGEPVLFISCEMPREQIALRYMVRISGVRSVRHPTREHFDPWHEARRELEVLPLRTVAPNRCTPAVIRSLIRIGPKPSLVVVDYLQLLHTVERKQSEFETISEVSRSLKEIAREFGIVVVALSQLSRDGAKEEMPRLWHLRQSGQIEQDADFVLLLGNPKNGEDEQPETRMRIDVAKHRNGQTGMAEVHWSKPIFRVAQASFVTTSVL